MMDGAHSGPLARWFQLLATKGVDELVFVNRSCPPSRALPLPSSLFSCASLCRLFIGAWVFPDTTALPRGPAFPNLRHLVLACVAIKDYDLEFVLAASPVLEVLTVTGSLTPLRARLTSRSLRCVQLCLSTLEEVAVVDAPSLERLFIYKNWNERHGLSNVRTTVKIGHAPKLRVLGYLEPGVHVLQISNTIIQVCASSCPPLYLKFYVFHDMDGTRGRVCAKESNAYRQQCSETQFTQSIVVVVRHEY
jgi:hypothetical protein